MPPLERHLRVQRTARFYQTGTPGPATREIWVACHGYGQLAAPFAQALEPLSDASRVVLAPEGLSRFYLDEPAKRHGPESPLGASWMTREDRENEITDYVEYLDAVASAVRQDVGKRDIHIVAFGFSQGVATACRWTALGRTKIHTLILWGGPLPNDLPSDKGDRVLRGARLIMVAGRQDSVVPVAYMEKEHREMAERGLHAELVVFDGAHALSSETLRRLATDVSNGA